MKKLNKKTIILIVCGFLKGGISKVYPTGSPFKTVADKSLVASILITIAKTKKVVSNNADRKSLYLASPATKKADITAVIIGNLPLQGTKLFVSIAINLSRGESIILQPVTPTALHPNPIHIVKACLPQEPHPPNSLSRLNATLGR